MKDRKPQKPLKHYSLIFLSISALGLTSSWLSSCSDTSAATTADHSNIEARLTRIEAKLGSPNDGSGNVSTMADLASKLSDDIGLMADRILEMADKIVETEELIVYVITNQTTAATGTINTLTGLKETPSSRDIKGPQLFPNFNPGATPFVLDTIVKGNGGSSVALKTPPNVSVTTNSPPTIETFGNTPVSNYILVASLDSKFINPVQREINAAAPLNTPPGPAGSPNPVNLSNAWKDLVGIDQLNIPVNANGGTKVFVAIKSLNITTGAVSSLSNSVAFTFN